MLRDNEIRGRIGSELTPALAENLGQAFGHYVIEKAQISSSRRATIAVAWDCRLSSAVYAASAVRGLRAAGADVIRLGTCPTALWNFGVFSLGVTGGLMVTGSNESLEYNGFKLRFRESLLVGDDLRKLTDLMTKSATPVPRPPGGYSDRQILPAYVGYHGELLQRRRARGRRAIIDTGNGTAGVMVRAVFRPMGGIEFLHAGVNGRFPNRHPYVRTESDLKVLAEAVRRQSADFGISIDGDSNQIVVVDEMGRMIPGERLAEILVSSAVLQGDFLYDDAVYSALRFYGIAGDHDCPVSALRAEVRGLGPRNRSECRR